MSRVGLWLTALALLAGAATAAQANEPPCFPFVPSGCHPPPCYPPPNYAACYGPFAGAGCICPPYCQPYPGPVCAPVLTLQKYKTHPVARSPRDFFMLDLNALP